MQAQTIAAIRFGYGFHPDQSPASGAGALIETLSRGAVTPPPLPGKPMAWRRTALQKLSSMRRDGATDETRRGYRKDLLFQITLELSQRLAGRALSPYGFFERLVAFWGDHFTVASKGVRQALFIPDLEITALRPNVMGSFSDLLTAAIQHPAMLIYLDQVVSTGPNSIAGQRSGRGLNENLARELLELHTLGAGGPYAQADVRAAAELLTGYAVNPSRGVFRFAPRRAEPGARSVMGRRYGGANPSPDHAVAMLHDLARHPITARHIARKLAVHFVSDDPDPDLVRHVEQAFLQSGGWLPDVYAALVEHPASWRDFGAKVKRPTELIVSTLRAIGFTKSRAETLGARGNRRLFGAAALLGQPLLRPPSPAGWPEEGDAWITPQGLAARLDYAGRAGRLLAKLPRHDARRFARTALGDALGDETAFAVGAAPERWQGFALAIASAEFNRR